MRITLIGTLALSAGLATGCATLDSDLQHRGTLTSTETNGLVLFEDGQSGHAAMFNTTCVVDPDGGIAEDVDIVREDEAEEVIDGTSNGEGSTVLARTRGELHIITSSLDMNGWSSSEPTQVHLDVPDVVDARLTDNGIAALAGCQIDWLDIQTGLVDASKSLADKDCDGMGQSLDVDAATGTAYLEIAGVVHAVTPDTVTPMTDGDLFAFSPAEAGVFAATSGERAVHFADADGTARWSAELAGPVTGLVDLGARGWMGAMVQMPDDRGQFAVIDAATGAIVKSFDLPSTADIVASANGQTLAMVLPREVHYYTLR